MAKPAGSPAGPTEMELEQRRRLRMVRAMQRGGRQTILGSSTAMTPGGPQPVQTQTILGG